MSDEIDRVNGDEEFSKFSNEQLVTVVLQALAMSASSLKRAAIGIRVLGERGADLSEIREKCSSILPLLRKIGSGQLLAEAVDKLAGRPVLLNRMLELPISDQRRVINDVELDVAQNVGGTIQTVKCKAVNMAPELVRQVFATGPQGHIRTVEEQIPLVRAKEAAQPKLTPDSEIKFDRSRKCFIIGTYIIPMETMKRLVSKYDR